MPGHSCRRVDKDQSAMPGDSGTFDHLFSPAIVAKQDDDLTVRIATTSQHVGEWDSLRPLEPLPSPLIDHPPELCPCAEHMSLGGFARNPKDERRLPNRKLLNCTQPKCPA